VDGFNLADIHEAIAGIDPDRDCIVWGERRFSWGDVTDRTRRLANHLSAAGLGCHTERSALAGWESGQDQLALYLYNGNEYLEGMLGGYKARCAPFNVNYRYVEDELLYLLDDAGASAIIYHAEFAPRLAAIRDRLPKLKVLLQVADSSGNALLDGAVDYEAALAAASPERPDLPLSGDDLYILYTGGTTGMPKGVLWRQHDIFMSALLPLPLVGNPPSTVDDVVAQAGAGGMRVLAAPPFMHGAAHWMAFLVWHSGGTVVIQRDTVRLDPDDIWATVERDKANMVGIVGDAFARPLIDQLRVKSYDLSSLFLLASGGAILSPPLKEELLELVPHLTIMDALGASETGRQGGNTANAAATVSSGTFSKDANSVILDEDRTGVVEWPSEAVGWLGQRGSVPLGYLGDPDKSRATFPVIDGVRYSTPGDRAQWVDADTYRCLGRDSVTINSGGEKIFAEEVESALKHHHDVVDAVVTGRPSERWGSEVVAIVSLRPGSTVTGADLNETAGRHLARFKLPKDFVFVDEVLRGPNGKADYRWAKATAADAGPAPA